MKNEQPSGMDLFVLCSIKREKPLSRGEKDERLDQEAAEDAAKGRPALPRAPTEEDLTSSQHQKDTNP
jgi:hypothetical protein